MDRNPEFLQRILDQKLAPLEQEIRAQTSAIQRLTEEVGTLHLLLVKAPVSRLEGGKSVEELRSPSMRKSLPVHGKLGTEDGRRKAEADRNKTIEGKREEFTKKKSDELRSSKEGPLTERDKRRLETRRKEQEEENKRKEEVRTRVDAPGKGKNPFSSKSEEVKRKPLLKKGTEKRLIEKALEDTQSSAEPLLPPFVEEEKSGQDPLSPVQPSESPQSLQNLPISRIQEEAIAPSFSDIDVSPTLQALDAELRELTDVRAS